MEEKNNQEAPQEQEPETQPEDAQAAAEPASEPEAPAQNAQEDMAAANDKYLRLRAEYDNFRKRSARERENIYTDVRVDTVTKFLPVYDNLRRALDTETTDEAYKKGVELTFNQLKDVMRKLGVEEIEAEGKEFDPRLHNAVMHVDDESLGKNIIVQEFEKGFKIGDKVIRFSMVKVAN